MNDLTLITAYYDLSAIEKRPYDKGKNNYLKWGNEIMKLKTNIVFYVDDFNISNHIWNQRKKYNLLDKTKIIIKEFSKLNWVNCIEEFKVYKKLHPIKNSSIRDSVNYMILTWNKVNFVEDTINKNPFNTFYFGWIDFGLCRGKRFSKDMDINDYITTSNKIRILEIQWITDKEQKIYKEYTSHLRYRVAGGLFIGNKTFLKSMIEQFRKYLYTFLSLKIVTTQEPILDYVYKNHYYLFNPYYGHYDQIIKNFKSTTDFNDKIINNIKYCRINNEYKHALDICIKLYKECYHSIKPNRQFQLNDEMIINSFYIDKQLSKQYVKRWLLELSSNKDQIPFIKVKLDRITNNLRFFEDGNQLIQQLDKLNTID
jgi:hypothetical protein